MGKIAHAYVKLRKAARRQLARIGETKDFVVESSSPGTLGPTRAQSANRWKETYQRMFSKGYIPAGMLLEKGIDLVGLPLKQVVLPKGTEFEYGLQPPQEYVWVPAWVIAIAVRTLDASSRGRLIQKAMHDPRQQIVVYRARAQGAQEQGIMAAEIHGFQTDRR